MGNHTNRVDAKGRVSVPAQFRAALRVEGQDGGISIYAWPSHAYDCIEGWSEAEYERMTQPLDAMATFSDEHEQFISAMISFTQKIDADREGRIVLPDWVIDHAKLGDSVMFVGMGNSFRIWEPTAGLAFLNELRAQARESRITVPGRTGAGIQNLSANAAPGTPSQ